MRIYKIASGADYRMAERFQNLPIFEANYGFPNGKILEIC